ncbi:protein phosphatase 2C domain-containing protein [Deinococcus fonticola]|uniref:protein phosphatase 2C domain-containing protein n=1 Tax=Deinococcus fonticola TaxID=2528713 RepID=UPI001F0D3CA2|nr:protein phosphatase 2C domain-containing protein [Deinococcus fonticola]
MTPPDDQNTPDLQAGLRDIFKEQVEPPAEPSVDIVFDADGLNAADETAVTRLQTESPAVSQETQTALEVPQVEEGMPAPEVQAPPSAPLESVPLEPAVDEAAEDTTPALEPAPAVPELTAPDLNAPDLAVPDSPSPGPVAAPLPVPAAPTPTSAGLSNDLEEVVYESTAPVSGPQEGQDFGAYHLDEDLGRGWFSAHSLTDRRKRDVYVRPDPLWAGVAAHRLLPQTTQEGDLHVVEPMAGPPLATPIPAEQARAYVTEFTRLLFALEKQGFAVTDIDPRSFLQTAQGLKLRFPPRLARLGEAVEPTLRDGFTPPEVQAGQAATARSGIYLLGALLFEWLTGQTIPPEGVSAVTLAGVSAPGMPQLLALMLTDEANRPTPTALLEYLKVQAANEIPKYDIAAATNIGLNPQRPTNEDAYGYFMRQVEAHAAPEMLIRACVSDGMGGMAAGEVASRAAVQAFLNSTYPTLPEMVWDANAAVVAAMDGKDGGCTISAVEIRGAHLQLGHVGDTRAYHRTGAQVTQLSKDHSYVAAMVASGQMTPDEAQNSPDRNKVLRSLGSLRVPQDNYVQTLDTPLELKLGDRILLVSDGVWGEVEPAELEHLLLTEPSPHKLVDTLLERALAAGAPDNITALVIERIK